MTWVWISVLTSGSGSTWCCQLGIVIVECSVAHRPLHSFPTRRSSDLSSCGAPGRGGGRPDERLVANEIKRAAAGRSEEHTSELQSRRELVCRLLLEKKKHEAKQNI